MRRFLALLSAALLTACGAGLDSSLPKAEDPEMFEGPIARATCGPNDRPETALQGQVPKAERDSGRSREGYNCNMELVGRVGTSATQGGSRYLDCYYYGMAFGPQLTGTKAVDTNSEIGTRVVNAADSANPVITAHLTTPAFLGPWESIRVQADRGLVAAVAGYGPAGNGPVAFDLYDIKDDCTKPNLLISAPINIPVGHEGQWSPDGQFYYASGTASPDITVIDVANPQAPVPYTVINTGSHGLNISDDGNRAYMTQPSCGNGLKIVDVSQIQARSGRPVEPAVLGETCWTDGATGQSDIPITIGGHPYLIFFDEGGGGGARIIDIADETQPRVISRLALEVHLPDIGAAAAAEDGVQGPGGGINGYNSHYCNVPQRHEPGVVACVMYNSGLRLIDIRDPYHPKELAYFKPPLPDTVTAPDMVAPPEFKVDRNEIWVTDRASGAFYAVRITNGVWPFK